MSVPRTLRTMTVGLLALACSALALTSGPAHAAAGGDTPDHQLRVMTYNIHHGAGPDSVLDLADTANTIEASHPDVVGLQEVDRHFDARSNFIDEARWLSHRLHMHVVYGANLDEDPPADGQPRRQYGTAILSRYPILDWSNTHLTKAGHPETEQRGLLYALLSVHGTPLRFYNTHLQTTASVRVGQVAQIKQLIGGSNVPMLLTGDLNAEPTSPEVTALTDVLADTWAEVGVGDGFTYDATKPHERIDFVLSSHDIAARATTVPVSAASDHLPMVADVTVPGRR